MAAVDVRVKFKKIVVPNEYLQQPTPDSDLSVCMCVRVCIYIHT